MGSFRVVAPLVHFGKFLIMLSTSWKIFGHHINGLHGADTSGLPGVLHGHSPELMSVVDAQFIFPIEEFCLQW